MKKIITIIIVALIICSFGLAGAQPRSGLASAKYYPVAKFLNPESSLSVWFKQYVDTTSGNHEFGDFLKALSASEVLSQRSQKAGLSHNQLYSPIITLAEKNWDEMENMNAEELATVRLAMLELDVALAAIDATLPATAHEEFRREVIRGAKPLTGVAKLQKGSVEQSSPTTMQTLILEERINNPTVKVYPSQETGNVLQPTVPSYFGQDW